MAPPTKPTRCQVGKKQSKISIFGRATKTATAALSSKGYPTKVTPAAEDNESTLSCIGVGKKRKHDAIDDDETRQSERELTTSLLKKVRGVTIKPASAPTYTF